MRKEVTLITGANGEVGHGLITHLGRSGQVRVVAVDLQPLDESLKPYCDRFIQGDILDAMLLGRLVSEFEIRTIFHLASLLSTRAEFTPEAAHRVNVEGTLNLLRLAVEQSQWQGRSVTFLYPSSIAAYGLPGLAIKARAGRLTEDEWCQPITMYGCNKLYCEHLGRYYTRHYRQLAADQEPASVDFRCLRFPGLISAETLPIGGTSDYGPEMLHHAAQGVPYTCFVREDTRLPFMAGRHQGAARAGGRGARAVVAIGVQREQFLALGAGDLRAREARLPCGRGHFPARSQPPGNRR
jgi:nucleoside-diphosphate-sugar epimerase